MLFSGLGWKFKLFFFFSRPGKKQIGSLSFLFVLGLNWKSEPFCSNWKFEQIGLIEPSFVYGGLRLKYTKMKMTWLEVLTILFFPNPGKNKLKI